MADKPLDFSAFGTLGPNQKRAVKEVKRSFDRGAAVKDIKEGVAGLAEDFSEGFSTAAEMASDFISSIGETDSSIANQGDVPEGVKGSSIGEKIGNTGEALGNLVGTATSTPAKILLQDLLIPDVAKGFFTIDETYLQADELEGLKQIVRKKGVGRLTKADYGTVTIGDVRGGNKKNVLTGGLTLGDKLFNTFSEANIIKDEETGEYFLIDQYDWNVYVDYTDTKINPKTGRPEGKVYKTEEFEESLSTGKEFWKTVTSEASVFEKAHNIAFLFGSRDYEGTDNPKDTGRQVRINLGRLD